MSPVLDIRGLRVTYPGGAHAVRGVDLSLEPGERVAVVGESGSGKSTLLAGVLGLLPRASRVAGSVRLDGAEVLGASERTLRRLRGRVVGYVPQDPYGAVDPMRTVRHHVAAAARAHGVRLSGSEVADRLRALGIPAEVAGGRSHPHTWSGGMLQRAVIAAATVHRPALVLADEPTSALDRDTGALVIGVLAGSAGALLLVTHDLDVAVRAADTVLVMYGGRVVERGPAARVLERPRHPYAAALVAAIPRPGRAPAALQGDPPDPRAVDDGCVFAPRCVHADDVCRAGRAPEGDVSCHRPI